MGLLDKAKKFARDHADKVDDAIDKTADAADRVTGGKHSEKVEDLAEKAKDAVDPD